MLIRFVHANMSCTRQALRPTSYVRFELCFPPRRAIPRAVVPIAHEVLFFQRSFESGVPGDPRGFGMGSTDRGKTGRRTFFPARPQRRDTGVRDWIDLLAA